ncbi:hypothetical protein HUJ05_007168 [Dendroctonus ponderosae]|nr:hypothetical protein HUJ05_007168 [Dendroctonus ponderosae]
MAQNSKQEKSTYEAINKIGRGAYGTVYKARNNETGQEVALKKVWIPLNEDGIPMNTLREIALLKQLNTFNHPNIVKLLDICHGQQLGKDLMMFLVFEHVEQDLAMYISKQAQGFSTTEIRNLSKEIVNGVDFLHSHRIVHRDLKPQNLLILLGLPYATSVDIWSIGCIIVELYTRKPLFCGKSEKEQLSEIVRVLGKPPKDEWPERSAPIKWSAFALSEKVDLEVLVPNMCENALGLVKSMLTFDPNKRISALEALSHEYFLEEPINT